MKKEILELHAEFCKTFSHPTRLQILNLLKDDEMIVTDMTVRLGLSKANVSRHLSLMRLKKILLTRREGANIYYRLANEELGHACSVMQGALEQLLEATSSRRY